ncbi:MAG: tetraacyldisaccharide 4'-kinase [Betaproteobacteria bacterium]|nr:tetraacyldisaccharide 4'-kinase [Betaproteobacteria bacterium]
MPRLSEVLSNAWAKPNTLSWVLLPLTFFSHGYLWLQNKAYQLGWKAATQLPVPVLVVGNIMVGGTGKTPIVIHLAERLTQLGWRVGVIARGHGGQLRGCTEVHLQSPASVVGDEALLLKMRLGLPVFAGKQRANAALSLLETYPQTQMILSDDGLQHRALHHDIAVCVFDDRGLGNGWLLPAGPLRETWPRSMKKGVVQLNVHTGSLAFADSITAQRQLAGFAVNGRGEQRNLQHWAGKSVDALAAIAQPLAFFSALQSLGLTLARQDIFADHDGLVGWQPASDNDLICTEKDAVKLWPQHPDVWAVPLSCELPEVFWRQLLPQLQRLSSSHGQQIA